MYDTDYTTDPWIVNDCTTAPRFAQSYSPDSNVALLLLRVQHLEEELSKIKEYLKGDDER